MTLYEQALEIAKKEGKVSISCLQRRLCLSYNEAGKILDKLKQDGHVNPQKRGIYHHTLGSSWQNLSKDS